MPVVEYFSSHSSLHSIARIHIHEYIHIQYKYEYYIRNGSQLHGICLEKVVDDRIWICRAFIAGLCVCLCCCAKLVFVYCTCVVPLIFNKLFSAECPKNSNNTRRLFHKEKKNNSEIAFLLNLNGYLPLPRYLSSVFCLIPWNMNAP